MKENRILRNRRTRDPYVDRRSGEDRRLVYDAYYFLRGGLERRANKERRQSRERRKDWSRVSKWSSVCTIDTDYLRSA